MTTKTGLEAKQKKTMATSEATVGQIPDIYGQLHPIETPDLIERKQTEFALEIEKIPSDQRQNAILAEDKCPDIVNTSFKLMFLRCEVFNADLAAKRYVKYWNKRVEIFGLDRAFQPLTVEHMTKEDIIAGEAGFANVIMQDKDNRAILFVDPSKHTRNNYQTENMIHMVWYKLHTILEESEYTQKRGIILMAYPHHAELANLDRTLLKQVFSSLQACIPIRLSVLHICRPPSIFKIVWPIASVFMSKRTKQRLKIHTGSQEDVLKVLVSKFQLDPKFIPVDLGGKYIVNPKDWMDKRRLPESVTESDDASL